MGQFEITQSNQELQDALDAVPVIQSGLTTETLDRISGDTYLQGQIDNLPTPVLQDLQSVLNSGSTASIETPLTINGSITEFNEILIKNNTDDDLENIIRLQSDNVYLNADYEIELSTVGAGVRVTSDDVNISADAIIKLQSDTVRVVSDAGQVIAGLYEAGIELNRTIKATALPTGTTSDILYIDGTGNLSKGAAPVTSTPNLQAVLTAGAYAGNVLSNITLLQTTPTYDIEFGTDYSNGWDDFRVYANGSIYLASDTIIMPDLPAASGETDILYVTASGTIKQGAVPSTPTLQSVLDAGSTAVDTDGISITGEGAGISLIANNSGGLNLSSTSSAGVSITSDASSGDIDIAALNGEVDIDANSGVIIDGQGSGVVLTATNSAGVILNSVSSGGITLNSDASSGDINIAALNGEVDIDANSGVIIDGQGAGVNLTATNSGGVNLTAVSSAGINLVSDASSGGINITTASGGIIINSATDMQLLSTTASYKFALDSTPPATASSTGEAGSVHISTDYIYVCTATNTWKRTALATW